MICLLLFTVGLLVGVDCLITRWIFYFIDA